MFHYPVKGMNFTPTQFNLCIPCPDFAKISKSPIKEQLENRRSVKLRWEKWKKANRPGKVNDFVFNTAGKEPEAAGAETSSEPGNQELDASPGGLAKFRRTRLKALPNQKQKKRKIKTKIIRIIWVRLCLSPQSVSQIRRSRKWAFAYVNKAAEGKDTLNWLMDYATPGFFDDSGTYDSSYGNMTKGEMDMFDQHPVCHLLRPSSCRLARTGGSQASLTLCCSWFDHSF